MKLLFSLTDDQLDSLDFIEEQAIAPPFFLELYFENRTLNDKNGFRSLINTASTAQDVLYSLLEIEHDFDVSLRIALETISEYIEIEGANSISVEMIGDDDFMVEVYR